jgi:hypothetical protein
MKVLRFAALLALASIPLLLVKREKQKPAEVVESDHIFDAELSVD